jgi:hypothetical protein
MADSVRVQFSASIGALISGVEDAKKAIEGVRESTDRVTDGAKHLLEAFGLAFSVDKIAEFIGKMADLGERTESMAAILGTSTEEIGRLDAIAKGTGTSTETLARGIEQFQVNLQKAQSSTSQQALALHALGLSAKDFIGLPVEAQLDKFADAVSRFADGGNKMAAVRVLFGRMGDELIPFFDKGSSGFRELAEMADRAGTTLSGPTAAAFAATRLKLVELGLSVEGLGIRVFRELEPVVDRAAAAVTKFIESIDSNTIETGLKNVGAVAVNILETISTLFVEVNADFQKLAAELGNFDLKRTALNILDPNLGDLVLGPTTGLDKTLSGIETTARGRLDAIKDIAERYRAAISSFSGRPQGGGGPLAGAPFAGGDGLPQVPALAVPNKDALSAQMAQYQSQIKLADEAFRSAQEHLGAEVKLHEISYDQETALLLAALDKRHAAEVAATAGEMSLYAKGTAGYEKALAERNLLLAKYDADRRKILDKQQEEDQKAWMSVFTPLQSAWDSQLKKLLSGTETFGQAMKNIFADLAMDAIKNLEKVALQKAAAGLTSALGGPQSALGGLSGLFGAGQAAAQTANTTALGLLTTAVTANTVALGGETAATTASAAGGAGGGLSSILSFVKLLLPGFADGSWSVPSDMAAQVHQGEVILPNNGLADAFRSGTLGSSSFGVAINGPVIGTQAFVQQLTQQLARTLQSFRARTPSMGW